MAATIGARLTAGILKNFKFANYWTDSTTVLAENHCGFYTNTYKNNKKKSKNQFLNAKEIKHAAIHLLRLIESQAFCGINDMAIKHLEPLMDENGRIR